MEDILKQQLDIDYMKLLYEDESVSIVECLLLHEGVNRNKCRIPHNVIINALPSLANKPIWGIPNNKFMIESSTDFIEHARKTEDRERIMIFGVFPESGVKNAEFVEFNGKTYLKVQAVLFKFYAPIAMSILKNRDGNTKISIEISVKGSQDEFGILDIEEMEFISATCLGFNIPEGIENSQLNIVRFSIDDAIRDYNNFYLSFVKKPITNFPKQGDNKDISLENSKYEQFDYDFALKIKEQYPSIWNIAGKDIDDQSFNYWSKTKENDNSKSIQNWIKRRESFTSRHHKNTDLINVVLNMKWGSVVNSEEYMKNTILNFIAKEKLGTEQAIKVNKSKEAMSDSVWSDENKSQLKKDCLMAKNWKTLCKAVFLRCDKEYLEGIEGALGYPVMEKKGDEVVYNRNGLASARAYAVKNNESEILSDLKSIYKHLNLEWDNEKEGEKVDNSKIENTEEIQTNVEEVDEIKTNATEEVEEINTNTEEEIDKTEESEKDKEVEENCKNCMSLEEELKNVKEELVKYKRIEEEQKMSSLLESYSHCFSKEEKEDISSEINKNSYEEFEKKIDNKIKEFVAKMKDIKPEDKKEDVKNEDKEEIKNTITFSVSPFGVSKTYDFSKNLGEKSGLDEIINNSGVKIKK